MTVQPGEHYGLHQTQTFGSDVILERQNGRVQLLSATSGGLAARLPSAQSKTVRHEGGPIFYLVNTGGFSIDIEDDGGNVIHTLATNTTCAVLLADRTTTNGVWYFSCDPSLVTNTTFATTTPLATTTTPVVTTTTPLATTPPPTTTTSGPHFTNQTAPWQHTITGITAQTSNTPPAVEEHMFGGGDARNAPYIAEGI